MRRTDVTAPGGGADPGRDDAVSRVTLAGRVKLSVALFLVLIAVSGAVAWTTVNARDRAIAVLDQQVEPARVVVNELLGTIVDQETGVRGYALTGDPTFAQRYRDGRQEERRLLPRLRELLAGEAELLTLVDDVADSAEHWREEAAEPELAAAEAGDVETTADLIVSDSGREASTNLRADLGQLRDRLRHRQAEARHEFDVARQRVTGVLVANLAVGTAVAVAALVLVTRWVTTPLGLVAAAARAVAGGALNRPIPSVGPPEIAALGADTERMRRRVVAELDAAVRAREALTHRGPLVALLRDELDPTYDALPEGLELASRFLPASGVLAGDWYDVFPRNDHRVVLALVDVSGHGPQAGVFALRAKQMVAAALLEDREPGAALGWVARHLGDTGDAFLTGLLVEIDPVTGDCRYASAGHPPALLTGANGVAQLGPTGPLLGPLPGSWETAETRLGPDGILVAYTDAVVESRNPAGEEFGTERLLASVARHHGDTAESAVDACLEEIRSFSRSDLADDLTLVAVARRPTTAA